MKRIIVIQGLATFMGESSIPVTRETRDLVKFAKGEDQTYDEFLKELIGKPVKGRRMSR